MFGGEKRSNATHASATDPEARLYRKGNGKESRLCYLGHALMEHWHGLVVDSCVTLANGTAERTAALAMVERHRPGRRHITLASDKGFDVASFVDDLRARRATPHLAVDVHVTGTGKRPRTRIGGRTTQHAGYRTSQRIRKRIEEIFGWVKVQGGQRQTRFRGHRWVEASSVLALAACNLVRLPGLLAAAPP